MVAFSLNKQLCHVVLLVAVIRANCFVGLRMPYSTPSRPSSTLHATKEKLVFTADCTFTSEPILHFTRNQLQEFFDTPETQLLLVSAGGKRQVIRYPTLTPELKQLWLDACDTYGSVYSPLENDTALASDAIIQFPGLRQITTVLNGVKTQIDANGLPKYVFILIGEKKQISGSPPIVWLYNKLTGADKEDADRFILNDTKASSVVSIVENPDGSVAFKFSIELQIKVAFPRALVKILPTTKEKMEEQGSAAVLSAISTDIVDSLTETRRAFIQQLEKYKA